MNNNELFVLLQEVKIATPVGAFSTKSDIVKILEELVLRATRTDAEETYKCVGMSAKEHVASWARAPEGLGGWISCCKKLPSDAKCVLMCVKGTFQPVLVGNYYTSEGCWKVLGQCQRLYSCEGVTHWMPLPELPAKE